MELVHRQITSVNDSMSLERRNYVTVMKRKLLNLHSSHYFEKGRLPEEV